MGMNRFNSKETDEEFISRALREEVSYSESIHLISWNYRKSYSDVFLNGVVFGFLVWCVYKVLGIFYWFILGPYLSRDGDVLIVIITSTFLYIFFKMIKLFFFNKSSNIDFFWHRGEVKVLFKIFDYRGRLERRVIPLKEINQLIVVDSRWRGDIAEIRGLLVKSSYDDIIIMYYSTGVYDKTLREHDIFFTDVLLHKKDYYTQLLWPVDDIETPLDGEYI